MAPRKGVKPTDETRALISIGLRWRWTNDPDAREKWIRAARAGGLAAAEKSRQRMIAYNKNPKANHGNRGAKRGVKSKISNWQVDPSGVVTRSIRGEEW